MEKVTLPPNTELVSDKAFSRCTSLKTVTVFSETLKMSATALDGCTSLYAIYGSSAFSSEAASGIRNATVSFDCVSEEKETGVVNTAVGVTVQTLKEILVFKGVIDAADELTVFDENGNILPDFAVVEDGAGIRIRKGKTDYYYVARVNFGDVNSDGKTNSADAVIILKYSAGLTGLSPIKLKEADLNRDGAVDESDAVLLLRRSCGLMA